MRRKAVLLTILPLSNALSLANFQQVTSIFIPISCQLTYDSQIPTCKVSDFQDGCSSGCQSALLSVANDVSDACSGTNVKSNTLLGIVMDGGILQALCQTTAKTTSVATPTTASAANSVTLPTTSPGVQLSTTSTEESVTIPTTSPGVQLSTTSIKSSKTTMSTTHTSATKTSSETSERTTASTTLASSTTAQSTETTESAKTTSTSTKQDSKTSKTTTAAAETSMSSQESESQGKGSGGGSPFDISSIGARIDGRSMLATVVAMWGCVLLGW